jgi:hypothetical protein
MDAGMKRKEGSTKEFSSEGINDQGNENVQRRIALVS